MKRFMSLAAVLVAVLAFSWQAHAADLKIYYIDSQRILTDSLAGKDVYKQLEVLKDERQKEIDTMQENLRKMGEDISVKEPTMNEQAKLELQSKYESELKKYNRFVKDAQEELRRRELTLVKPISDEVSTIIDEYGKQNSIDIILDRRDPGIIYASDKLDITNAILQRYDKKYKESKGKK
ncbi:MAG: periplasmic chaperone [Deltaproteobacteria bacterium ADurb.BinA179]|jgi:outer membrane protein|nr:OmpH family outer membrane protein [Deltaproteobacteria bacterium]NLW67782.1 OmpH family outer membrane protein [Bacteriovoracaceae bacterium]OPZ28312.1 MAG: periplasmic chaperone [Deltaproteobacteria bacterium ADurb.BinA179]HRR67844.1 OmpH family outer membrane protein [Desulfomonilia bacterium]HNU73849.1 OmpH family outer membrane protein [Deltaproteobacteria bacterium]